MTMDLSIPPPAASDAEGRNPEEFPPSQFEQSCLGAPKKEEVSLRVEKCFDAKKQKRTTSVLDLNGTQAAIAQSNLFVAGIGGR